MTAAQKLEKLKDGLRGLGSVAVAFSGGADSTFLLKTAHDVLGGGTLAITAASPFYPRRELEEARDFCKKEGIGHVIREIDMLAVPGLADNPPDRCYLCKKAILAKLLETAEERGISRLAEGSNVDDDKDFRPGARAVAESGTLSPLRHAGLTKAEIRALSKEMRLPVWDKPAFACLASRIPYGMEITRRRLSMIDGAEQYLRDNGFNQIRVRCHGDLARIETDAGGFGRLMSEDVRAGIAAKLKEIGFTYVSLDLMGYRMGSMNEALPETAM